MSPTEAAVATAAAGAGKEAAEAVAAAGADKEAAEAGADKKAAEAAAVEAHQSTAEYLVSRESKDEQETRSDRNWFGKYTTVRVDGMPPFGVFVQWAAYAATYMRSKHISQD